MQHTKFWIKDIKSQPNTVDMLSVHSYEMDLYLVKLSIGDNTGWLYEGSRPKRFNSTQQIRDVFNGLAILAAQMLHESPYDEMIGSPESLQGIATLPFYMR